MSDNRSKIAKRVAKEFKNGDVVNLGIGIPTLVTDYLPEGVNILVHAECGLIGAGKTDSNPDSKLNCVDAGGKPIEYVAGAAFFDSTKSFSFVRSGRLAFTVLGALQVDEEGNIANWMVPGGKMHGMGGAMDLLVGAKKVIVAMEHTAKGKTKIVKKCTMPLTASKEVDLIITELCVIEVVQGKGLILKELSEGVTVEDVLAVTEAELIIDDSLK